MGLGSVSSHRWQPDRGVSVAMMIVRLKSCLSDLSFAKGELLKQEAEILRRIRCLERVSPKSAPYVRSMDMKGGGL